MILVVLVLLLPLALATAALDDFEDIPLTELQQITSLLEQNGVYLMISPDSLSSLNKEAIRRLETGRLIRQ